MSTCRWRRRCVRPIVPRPSRPMTRRVSAVSVTRGAGHMSWMPCGGGRSACWSTQGSSQQQTRRVEVSRRQGRAQRQDTVHAGVAGTRHQGHPPTSGRVLLTGSPCVAGSRWWTGACVGLAQARLCPRAGLGHGEERVRRAARVDGLQRVLQGVRRVARRVRSARGQARTACPESLNDEVEGQCCHL